MFARVLAESPPGGRLFLYYLCVSYTTDDSSFISDFLMFSMATKTVIACFCSCWVPNTLLNLGVLLTPSLSKMGLHDSKIWVWDSSLSHFRLHMRLPLFIFLKFNFAGWQPDLREKRSTFSCIVKCLLLMYGCISRLPYFTCLNFFLLFSFSFKRYLNAPVLTFYLIFFLYSSFSVVLTLSSFRSSSMSLKSFINI